MNKNLEKLKDLMESHKRKEQKPYYLRYNIDHLTMIFF